MVSHLIALILKVILSTKLFDVMLIYIIVMQKAEEIVKMLDRHPLGIDQASAYIRNRPFITLNDYIEKFKNKLEETRPRELMIRNENLWPDYSLTCMTTFEISRDAIENEMSDAVKVLQLCCWLDRDDIWIPFLKAHKQSVSLDLRGMYFHRLITKSRAEGNNR